MIVYVESNFILELAFLRGERTSCDALVALAQAGKVTLALPAFTIAESYTAWGRNKNRRMELSGRISTEVNELARSHHYQELSGKFQDLRTRLVSSIDEEKHQLDEALAKILSVAEVIPIGSETIQAAITWQTNRNLLPQDAIIYASILGHLAKTSSGRHCFISQDKDFANPEIERDLAAYGCLLLSRFSNGLGFIRSQL
jgi:hypothetical protein